MSGHFEDEQYHDVCRWLSIRCTFPDRGRETLQTLHRDYECWSAAQPGKGNYQRRARHVGKNTFSSLLREIGLEFAKSSQRWVIGIGLVDEDPWGAPAQLPEIKRPPAADDVSNEIDDLPFD